jgi:hypothetical protein
LAAAASLQNDVPVPAADAAPDVTVVCAVALVDVGVEVEAELLPHAVASNVNPVSNAMDNP